MADHKRVRDLRAQASCCVHRRKRRKLELEADELDEIIKQQARRDARNKECLSKLKDTTCQALISGISRVPLDVQFNDMDKCPKCNVDYVSITRQCMVRCPKCHKTMIDYRSPTETMGDLMRRPPIVVDSKAEPTVDSSLFRKFLTQYAEDQPEIPEAIIALMVREHFKIHMYSNDKVSNTVVVNTLRDNNCSDYIFMSQRIMKVLQNEPVPVYSHDLINRMVNRYNVIIPIFRSTKNGRKKSPNFTCVTRAFLTLEGEEEEARKLRYHKTRSVMISSMQMIRKLCEFAAKLHPNENWTLPRIC